MLKGKKDGKVVLVETDTGKLTVKDDKILQETLHANKKLSDREKAELEAKAKVKEDKAKEDEDKEADNNDSTEE